MSNAQKRKFNEAQKYLLADAKVNDFCADLLKDDEDIFALIQANKAKNFRREQVDSEESGDDVKAKLETRKHPPSLIHSDLPITSRNCQKIVSKLTEVDCPRNFCDSFNPKNKGKLRTLLSEDSFCLWCVEDGRKLPTEILDAIYIASLQSEDAFLDLACLAHKTLISLIEITVRCEKLKRSAEHDC